VTYFKNPHYPNITMDMGSCLYRVNLLPGVCQLRVDILDLRMKNMVSGECEQANALNINSNDPHAYIPIKSMCGAVSQGVDDPLRTDIPHMYIHLDNNDIIDRPSFKQPNAEQISVNFRFKVENFASRWNLRISQIQCDGANLQSPSGCAQYYNQNKGNITSLNFHEAAYKNNMDMSICLKRDPAACAIHYKMHSMAIGQTKGGIPNKPQVGYGLTCDDYLIFNGQKTAMCGELTVARNYTLPIDGPPGLTLHTDGNHVPKADVGFHLEYEYLHNCTEVDYFQYPSPVKRK